jgi:chromosomal replication initiation ATPase DnaA
MNIVVNIFEMPAVLNIITAAEHKISKLTGCPVKLLPHGVGIYQLDEKKEKLKTLTEKYFGYPWHMIISKSRSTNLVYARYFYAWGSVKILKQILETTGEDLGNRDHTTVINGLGVMKKHIKNSHHWGIQLNEFINLYQIEISKSSAEL